MKCLIIDDDGFSREFVATLLGDDAESHQAASGSEGVAQFTTALESEAPFDLIILDIMMPDMNGHETAKAIRTLEKAHKPAKKVHIVMLTALNSPNDAFESLCNAQSAAYLVKPISKQNLFNVVSKLGLLRK